MPELIEYYDDTIYPDPDSGAGSVTTKFNELQELNGPMDGIKNANVMVIDKMELTTLINVDDDDVDDTFKGKSIDFNVMQQHTIHTVEELNNEDLRDHDIIDNIMFIYYGSNSAMRKSLGGSIIIVGTVFALAAQILCIIFTLLRNRLVISFQLNDFLVDFDEYKFLNAADS